MSQDATNGNAPSMAVDVPSSLPQGYPDPDNRGRARKSYNGKLLDFGTHGTPKSIERFNSSPIPAALLKSLAANEKVTTLPLGYPLKADARGDAAKSFRGKQYYFGKHGTAKSVERFNNSPVGQAFAAAARHGEQSGSQWRDLDGTIWNQASDCELSDQSLLKHREEVEPATASNKVDGKVRAKLVPISTDLFHEFTGVYHAEDDRELAREFALPEHLDLLKVNGGQFGRWRVTAFDDKLSEKKKRHWWKVRCTCKARTKKSISATSLLNGKSKGCVECKWRFVSVVAKREHQAKEEQIVDGRLYWSPRNVMKILEVTWTTLCDKGKLKRRTSKPWIVACPHLPGGRGMRTRTLPAGYGRIITYFDADDVQLVRTELDAAVQIPSFPDATHLPYALVILRVTSQTFHRRLKAAGGKIEKRTALGKDRRSIKRTYVPNWFIKQQKPAWSPPNAALGATSETHARMPVNVAAPRVPVVEPPAAPVHPRKKGGREIDPENLPKYKLCHEMYELVQTGKQKTIVAVKEVLRQFGKDALGSFDESADPNRKYRDQKKRMKDNAKKYRKYMQNSRQN